MSLLGSSLGNSRGGESPLPPGSVFFPEPDDNPLAVVTDTLADPASPILAGSGSRHRAIRDTFSVKDYGAKGDCQQIQVTTQVGQPIVDTLHPGTVSLADVGKTIIIPGAGVAGATLVTTITGIFTTQKPIVGVAPSTVVTAKPTVFGTDDTAPISTALTDSRGLRATTYFPSGNYLVTDNILTIPAAFNKPGKWGASIRGDGGDNSIITFLTPNGLLVATGNLGTGNIAAPNAGVAMGTTLTLPSTTGFVEGDYILLSDPDQPIRGAGDNSIISPNGEICRVQSITDPTHLQVYGGLELTYGPNSTYSAPVPLYGFSVEEMGFHNPAPGTNQGGVIGLACATHVHMHNLRFQGVDGQHIRLQLTWDFYITDCEFDDASDLAHNGSPYNVCFADWTGHGIMSGCVGTYGRHMVTTTNQGNGPAQHILVANCNGRDYTEAVYDNHPGARNITYLGCVAHNIRSYGFQMRSPDCDIIDPMVKGSSTTLDAASAVGYGILITDGANRCHIQGGRLTTLPYGIVVQDSNDTKIRGTWIEDFLTAGVRVFNDGAPWPATSGFAIDDVDIVGGPNSAAATGILYNTWGNSFRHGRVRFHGSALAATVTGRSLNTIASAASISIPWTADVHQLVGTNVVSTIIADLAQMGRTVRLVASVTGASLANGGNITLKTADAWVAAAAGDSIDLACKDGTTWAEVSRSTPLDFAPTKIAASGNVPVPAGARYVRATGGGGSGGGGGAGSSATATAQAGAGGGGTGGVTSQLFALGANTSLTAVCGAGGIGGNGGAAGVGAAGAVGGQGGQSTLTGTGISAIASGGSGGTGGPANSTALVGAGIMGSISAATRGATTTPSPGAGGAGASGGAPMNGSGGGGGAGGPATVGGAGGPGGAAGTLTAGGAANGGSGGSGTNGGNGATAAAGSRAGGGGGGGGNSGTGKGGDGGSGDGGWWELEWF